MRRTTAFVLLLIVTVLWAGCATSNNSNTGKANMSATPANANTGKANTNNANTHGNMNMGKANKKPNAD